jgi:hypothetical protein
MPNIRSPLPPCSRIFAIRSYINRNKILQTGKDFSKATESKFQSRNISVRVIGKSTVGNVNNLQRSRTVRSFSSPKWNQSLISKEE